MVIFLNVHLVLKLLIRVSEMWNVLSVDFLSFALLFFFSNIICNLKINISFPFLPYSDNSSFANIYIYI